MCGAKRKQGKGPCRATALYPNGRCRVHGGPTPVGPASPHFVTGRHSRLLKEIKGFGTHYERALADPDLLRLDSEVALIDARIGDLLERTAKAKGAKQTIDGIWPQLEALIEQRRKTVDTESKRLKDLHAMVSVDRVLLIVRYLHDAIRRHVASPAEQTAVFGEMRRLLKPESEAL